VSDAVVAESPVVEVHELARHFGGVQAVSGASFGVDRGSITGLIGPNGAGKSTLVDVVSGFVAPSGGRVIFDGEDITGWPAHRIARRGLVRTFQLSRECPRLTVLENLLIASPDVDGVAVLRSLFGKRRWRSSEQVAVDAAQQLLVKFGLAQAQDTYAGELSGGQ
jgi:ABC-type branched-subunit amino acid transport system ATPase component